MLGQAAISSQFCDERLMNAGIAGQMLAGKFIADRLLPVVISVAGGGSSLEWECIAYIWT
jgi:hypothetical protein